MEKIERLCLKGSASLVSLARLAASSSLRSCRLWAQILTQVFEVFQNEDPKRRPAFMLHPTQPLSKEVLADAGGILDSPHNPSKVLVAKTKRETLLFHYVSLSSASPLQSA